MLYLADSHCIVRTFLVQQKLVEDKLIQSLVYFVSEVLIESKTHMSKMEKIAYVVVMASRKFWHYFEAHNIKVLTNRSLSDIYNNPKASA